MPDVVVHDEGSIVGFTPLSAEARKWIDENVQSEGWQWMGSMLCVDQRFAGDLCIGLMEAGLEVS